MKYKCNLCEFIYDNDSEDSSFEPLPNDWTCPLCGAEKTTFSKET